MLGSRVAGMGSDLIFCAFFAVFSSLKKGTTFFLIFDPYLNNSAVKCANPKELQEKGPFHGITLFKGRPKVASMGQCGRTFLSVTFIESNIK